MTGHATPTPVAPPPGPGPDTLDADRRAWRDRVARFAREHVAPLSASMDRAARLDPGLRERLFAEGLMAVEAPVHYGGAGGTLFDVVLTIEEISRVDPGVAVAVDIQNTLVVASLLRQGSGDQRRRYLPRLATGTLGAFSLSEPDAGSDAFATTTTAEPTADGWTLRGRKRWTSVAPQADLFLLFARIPDLGVTAFLVEADSPGLVVEPYSEQLGVRAAATADVVLADVAVRPRQCLGVPGGGETVAVSSLDVGRIGIAAQQVGLAQGALDVALAYSREREQFGRRIADFQGVQFTLARTATEVAAARSLLYETTRAVSAGAEGPELTERLRLSAMAKLFASQVAQRAAIEAVDVLGGNGFVAAHPAERFYRDAKAGTIYEGTSNVLLRGIAGGLAVSR